MASTADLRTSTGLGKPRLGGLLRAVVAQGWWFLPVALIALLFAEPRLSALDPWTVKSLAAAPCDRSAKDEWQLVNGGPIVRRGNCWLVRVPRDPATALAPADLLLFGLHADADVFDDGRTVASRDTDTARSAHAGYRQVRLPAIAQPAGGQEILLTIRSDDSDRAWIRLARVVLAPEGSLSDWTRAHDLRQRDGARLALATMFALLIVVTPMLLRRMEPVAIWYAVSLIGAGLYVAQFATDTLPFDMTISARSAIAHIGLIMGTWATLRFSCQMTASPSPRWADFAAAISVVLLIWLTFKPYAPLAVPLHVAWRALMLAMMAWLLVHWWRRRGATPRPGGAWFAGAMAALIVLGGHDTVRSLSPDFAPSAAYLLHWGILYLVALMFAALLTRLLDALVVAETAGERLGAALTARTRDLEAEYTRRRAAEADAMIANERHRLMRDMHDGIGGQIVALIAQAERRVLDPAALAGQLRRTLDDLRLVIDSLDSACADLGVALGMLRGRLSPLLAGLPVEVRWRTAHLPDLPPAPPGTVLGVMRIVQEALTNALKHSGASTIDIEADWSGDSVTIVVTDDGQGFERDTVTAGRGLASLEHRAAAIGGTLTIDSASGTGTRVTLRLPLATLGNRLDAAE